LIVEPHHPVQKFQEFLIVDHHPDFDSRIPPTEEMREINVIQKSSLFFTMVSLQNSVFLPTPPTTRMTHFIWRAVKTRSTNTTTVDDQESEDEHQDIKKNINNKSNRNFQFSVGKKSIQSIIE